MAIAVIPPIVTPVVPPLAVPAAARPAAAVADALLLVLPSLALPILVGRAVPGPAALLPIRAVARLAVVGPSWATLAVGAIVRPSLIDRRRWVVAVTNRERSQPPRRPKSACCTAGTGLGLRTIHPGLVAAVEAAPRSSARHAPADALRALAGGRPGEPGAVARSRRDGRLASDAANPRPVRPEPARLPRPARRRVIRILRMAFTFSVP